MAGPAIAVVALVTLIAAGAPGPPALAQPPSPAAIVVRPNCGDVDQQDVEPRPRYAFRVDGTDFNPFTAVLVTFDAGPGGRPESFPARTDGFGRFSVGVNPTHRPAGTYVVRADDFKQREATAEFLVPCPLLVLQPPIGPPGFVTMAVGTGFHPDTSVVLSWSPATLIVKPPAPVVTDAAGSFRTPVLISYREALGRRQLTATTVSTGRVREASAGFLVVPGRGQPSDFQVRR